MFPSNSILHFVKMYKYTNNFMLNVTRTKTSALYITGDKAHETFSVLTPHLDFDERLERKAELENNLKRRGIHHNLDDTIRVWNFFKHVELKKVGLDESKISISQTIKNLSKNEARYAAKIENLKAHGKMVKEDLRVLKESLWSIEEKAALKVLSLPNDLHENTPDTEVTVVHVHLADRVKHTGTPSHLDTAIALDLVEYLNPNCYFLKNEAALFDMASQFYFGDFLVDNNYCQFSSSDFSRSVIVEGCGLEYSDPCAVFTVNELDVEHKHNNSRLHLTGSASLAAFMAYYARHTVHPSSLPLRHFSVGRTYQPASGQRDSLCNVSQQTAVSVFVATPDDHTLMNSEFASVLQHVIAAYETLGHHFRVCFLPANQLQHWESLRASIQMFSSHLNEYIEVGNVSLCGNYISKRLQFSFGKVADIHYPYVITGTVFSVPRILACILETDGVSSANIMPDTFRKYIV